VKDVKQKMPQRLEDFFVIFGLFLQKNVFLCYFWPLLGGFKGSVGRLAGKIMVCG
jgi:hypothetical protein